MGTRFHNGPATLAFAFALYVRQLACDFYANASCPTVTPIRLMAWRSLIAIRAWPFQPPLEVERFAPYLLTSNETSHREA